MNAPISSISELASSLDDSAMADLLEVGRDAEKDSVSDYGEIWDFFMMTPIGRAINQTPARHASPLRKEWQELLTHDRTGLREQTTFYDILRPASSKHEIMRFVKRFGKGMLDKRQRRWPRELGYALYYAAYAVDLTCNGKMPGKLRTDEFLKGLRKVMRYSWIPEPLRNTYKDAERVLAQQC